MAKRATGVGNYQSGGPSGEARGTKSYTVKRRVRGGKTDSVHARCDRNGGGGELCAWMELQFAKILARAAKAESDEKKKRARLKAAGGGK